MVWWIYHMTETHLHHPASMDSNQCGLGGDGRWFCQSQTLLLHSHLKSKSFHSLYKHKKVWTSDLIFLAFILNMYSTDLHLILFLGFSKNQKPFKKIIFIEKKNFTSENGMIKGVFFINNLIARSLSVSFRNTLGFTSLQVKWIKYIIYWEQDIIN